MDPDSPAAASGGGSRVVRTVGVGLGALAVASVLLLQAASPEPSAAFALPLAANASRRAVRLSASLGAWLSSLPTACPGAAVLPLDEAFLGCLSEGGDCERVGRPTLGVFKAWDCLRVVNDTPAHLVPLSDGGHYFSFNASWAGGPVLPRLLPKFTLTPSTFPALLLPADTRTAALMLNASEARDCNRVVAASFHNSHPGLFATAPLLPDSIAAEAAYLRDVFLRHGVLTFLFGGTLLGWYRECGIIPYTTDLDLAAEAEDYSPELERSLIDDKRMRLYWILGKKSDSLELSVHVRPVGASEQKKIDVFFLNHAAGGDWAGGMIVWKKQKLRWDYPALSAAGLCSGVLLGEVFWVPCDVEAFLRADYGPGWAAPAHDSAFVWYKDHKNVQENGRWTRAEWPAVYRTRF